MQLPYKYLLLILSVIITTFITSGCSSSKLDWCGTYIPMPITVAFEKIEYDSLSHKIEIEGKVFYDYYENTILPAIVVVTFDLKDSLRKEGSMEPLYTHKPLEITSTEPQNGNFRIEGTFNDDMIMYIYGVGYTSLIYELKDLLGFRTNLKFYYNNNIKKTKE